MAVGFLDLLLEEEEKPSDIPSGIFAGLVVVLCLYGRMAVGFLDPIGRGGKTEQYSR